MIETEECGGISREYNAVHIKKEICKLITTVKNKKGRVAFGS
jgi:hypothetical protein